MPARAKSKAKTSAALKRPTSPKPALAKRVAPAPVVSPFRPVPLYEFSYGGLVGTARLSDPGRGLSFTGAVDEKRLPAVCEEVLGLRHYFSLGEGGLLAPREEAPCEGKVEKQAVIFGYDKPRNWPLSATARYELLPQGGAEATFIWQFSKSLKALEAGIETLMPRSLPAIYVHSGGSWVRATVGPQAQRFYPRNQGAAELIADGRWDRLRYGGVTLTVEPRGYDYPLVVAREERSGWALCYMALTEECTSVWINGAQRGIGLGFIGADVKAQSKINCRARVVLCQAARLDDALSHYREFVQQARARK